MINYIILQYAYDRYYPETKADGTLLELPDRKGAEKYAEIFLSHPVLILPIDREEDTHDF